LPGLSPTSGRSGGFNKSQVAAVEHNKVRLAQKVSAITTRAFVSPERAEKGDGKKQGG